MVEAITTQNNKSACLTTLPNMSSSSSSSIPSLAAQTICGWRSRPNIVAKRFEIMGWSMEVDSGRAHKGADRGAHEGQAVTW